MTHPIQLFDGRDNRRELLLLLERLGRGLDEQRAGMRRSMFLRGLLDDAAPQWRGKRLRIDPCSTMDAYFLLLQMAANFGVDLEKTAKKLEDLMP